MSTFVIPQRFTSKVSFSELNVRGEDRWTKNVSEALVSAGHTIIVPPNTLSDINNHQYVGKIIQPKHSLNEVSNLCKDAYFITHGVPHCAFWIATKHDDPNLPKCRKYILNFFSPPGTKLGEGFPESVNLMNLIGEENVFITHSFSRSPEMQHTAELYQKHSLQDRVRLLQTPAVKQVHFNANNFHQNNLVWFYRDLYGWLFRTGGNQPYIKNLFNWILEKLKEDKNKRFKILTGYGPLDQNNNRVSPLGFLIQHDDDLFKYAATAPLMQVRNQIDIIHDLDWNACIDLMSETKLLVNIPMRYGGPPLEAGSFGIPTIGLPNISSFIDMPGYKGFNESDSAIIQELEKFYTDESYYRNYGNKQRNYVYQHWTYDAFVKNLMKLLGE